jgi:hypothetical protein
MLDMRNDGFWKVFMDIYSTKGVYGFFVGWRLFMMKIPVYIFNLLLANAVFMQLKTLFNPRTLPSITNDNIILNDKKSPLLRRPPIITPQNNTNNNGLITEDDELYLDTDDDRSDGGGGEGDPPSTGDGPPDAEKKRDGWYRVNSATF